MVLWSPEPGSISRMASENTDTRMAGSVLAGGRPAFTLAWPQETRAKHRKARGKAILLPRGISNSFPRSLLSKNGRVAQGSDVERARPVPETPHPTGASRAGVGVLTHEIGSRVTV